jgi:hypothetical protein
MWRLRYIIGAVLGLVILYVIARKMRRERIAKQSLYEKTRREKMRPEDNYNTIFVAIPCYRDEHACAETLYSLFNEASCPWRLRVAVMHHMQPGDDQFGLDLISLYEHVVLRHNATSFQAQIRVNASTVDEALGPWEARRYLLRQVFQNERFVLLVNSNTQLVRNWDALCLNQYAWALRLNPRPILTTYPALVDPEQPLEERATYPVMADHKVTAAVYNRTPVRPFPTYLMCPAFAFASSRWLTDVPDTLHLPHVSNQHGMVVAAAHFYTHGWDFYTPTVPLVYRTARSSRKTDERQLMRLKGLLDQSICRICDEPHTDEFAGHPFEPWPQERVFGTTRSLYQYFEQKDTFTSAEEQIAKSLAM